LVRARNHDEWEKILRRSFLLSFVDHGHETMTTEDDTNFDVLIEGTGLTESILAAAVAWAGKKVLHVDRNTFYGSHWAALSIDEIDVWVQDNSGKGRHILVIARLTS
jgi:hypothetical protein